MRLLLIADTHIPKRARDLPAQVWDEVAQADVVIHAGDWISPEFLDRLESAATRLVGCWETTTARRCGPGSPSGRT